MIWNIDPEIIHFGPFALRWYGLFFALGFLVGYFIVKRLFESEHRDTRILDSLLVSLVIATIVGARLGHVLFYEPIDYLSRPWRFSRFGMAGSPVMEDLQVFLSPSSFLAGSIRRFHSSRFVIV